MLVFDAEAGEQTEEEPGAGSGAAFGQAKDDEERTHPEAGLEGVHGEIVGGAEEDGSGKDGGHGQDLRGAAATELPGDEAGEGNCYATGSEAENANAGWREAEEGFGEAGLEGDQRRLINVTPGQMMAADEEGELVTEETVAEMGAPEGADLMDQEGDRGKEGSEQEGGAQGRSHRNGRKVFWQGCGLSAAV